MNRFKQYTSFQVLESKKTSVTLLRILSWTLAILVIIMLLPWTQTISSVGNVTALSPNNRPQTIQAIIGGRIEKWYVQEGQFVKKGDTIAFLSEVKSEYMDPNLIVRTEEQVKSKESSADSYISNSSS